VPACSGMEVEKDGAFYLKGSREVCVEWRVVGVGVAVVGWVGWWRGGWVWVRGMDV
jgi:hypothetical protein